MTSGLGTRMIYFKLLFVAFVAMRLVRLVRHTLTFTSLNNVMIVVFLIGSDYSLNMLSLCPSVLSMYVQSLLNAHASLGTREGYHSSAQ